MKVLAFAASNSRQSINQQLVKYAASKIENAEVEILDLNDLEMPIYSSDRESESGIPDQAQRFYDKIGAADVILVSFAEHNGSYTAAYKNIFDWTSRINMKVYQDTPMLLMATSPGPGGAQSVLGAAVNSAPYFAADVKASLSVPSFFDNFDVEAGKLTNDEIEASLESALKQLAN
ncbi:NADPH-dependent FMN reductase [Pseudoalteromonas luteoviolacea]|uniref:NADPH-dependent FMN reductase n=1 Tax=Pseudoalteromonas luteoviolacea NCIMB 1942 TaxID=1365253 RepID=A0A166Z3C3_9GAMM|nr:NAD(P)H-dependent oxidoreductase [Pseudoalteromonas luteoviolacea]KZN43790.1 NADPH-dependent FMN reductase [Pseudoalteromonas luteoviolacea NCIMB 1942]KZX01482.1 NADPH-dependent FMN reductase [Pseudoalteromonas luteoviolacea]